MVAHAIVFIAGKKSALFEIETILASQVTDRADGLGHEIEPHRRLALCGVCTFSAKRAARRSFFLFSVLRFMIERKEQPAVFRCRIVPFFRRAYHSFDSELFYQS